MKNRLLSVSDEMFRVALELARENPDVITPHHMLLKLVIFDFVAPIVEGHSHGEILEIGCGHGVHSALLTGYGNVSATDLATPGSFVGADNVDRKRKLVLAALASRPVAFTYNDGRRLPYGDSTFDLVFHNSVIEHVPDVVAFNREVRRVLKPGGTCVCITGTPVLCALRLVKDYALRLPRRLASAVIREGIPRALVAGALKLALHLRGRSAAEVATVDQRFRPLDEMIRALAGAPPVEAARIEVPRLYSRLQHFLSQPVYNAIVVEDIARRQGISVETLLHVVATHFGNRLNRLRFWLTPPTHGQHYRSVWHEFREWRIARWREQFTEAGFIVEDITGYRYHHLLEITPSYAWDASLYHRAAKHIRTASARRRLSPARASEIIIVVQRDE